MVLIKYCRSQDSKVQTKNFLFEKKSTSTKKSILFSKYLQLKYKENFFCFESRDFVEMKSKTIFLDR